MRAEPANLEYGSVLIVNGRVYVDWRPLDDLGVYADPDAASTREPAIYVLTYAPKNGESRVFEVLNKYDLCAKILNLAETEDEINKPFVAYKVYLKGDSSKGTPWLFESPDFAKVVEVFSDMIDSAKYLNSAEVSFVKVFCDAEGDAVKSVVLKKLQFERGNQK